MGVNRLSDSGVNILGDSGVNRLGDTSAFVNMAGQLLLTRRGKSLDQNGWRRYII